MENLKNIALKFWSSTFNKVWIIGMIVSIAYIMWGKKNRKFNNGIMAKVPTLLPLLGVALFFSKKWIVKPEQISAKTKSKPHGYNESMYGPWKG